MKKYLGIFAVFFIGYFFISGIYNEISKDKTPGKAKRLACQKKVTTFERAYSPLDIKTAQHLITHGSIDFTSKIEKAIYSEPRLFNHVSLQNLDTYFQKELTKYVQFDDYNSSKYKLMITITENDKKDPGKKTNKSKLFVGYTALEVKNLKNQSIYKVQIDFMDRNGADINDSLKCSLKSFMTYNK